MMIVLDKFWDGVGHAHYLLCRIWQGYDNSIRIVAIGGPVVGILVDCSVGEFLPDHNLRPIPVAQEDATVFVRNSGHVGSIVVVVALPAGGEDRRFQHSVGVVFIPRPIAGVVLGLLDA